MESTTNRTNNKPRKRSNGSWLARMLGGEFLLSKQMIPWYPFIAFLLILMGFQIISEQRIIEKREKIKKLENVYKAELSKLKSNNQFIPYEENQLLIKKMEEHGYQLNEEHTYTILIKKPAEEKKRFSIFRKKKKVTQEEEELLNTQNEKKDEKRNTKS